MEFQHAVEITIRKRVTASDFNKSLELVFGDTYEPLPEMAHGQHTVVRGHGTR